MGTVLGQVLSSVTAMSPWEWVAVALAVAYLLLAMRESLWCWACAGVSTVIYMVLFWNVSLLMESALNVFYLVMAFYGFWQWRRGGSRHQGVVIHRWPLRLHLLTFAVVAVATALSGYWLTLKTQAVWPYVDAFTTWGAVITTFMVARKVIENWLYWIVIDGVSVFLYLDRGMYLTAALFVAYVVIVVFGYFNWRRHERALHDAPA